MLPLTTPVTAATPGGLGTNEHVRLALEEAAAAASQVAEQAWTYAELLDQALAILAAERGEVPLAPALPPAITSAAPLSPREQEVLALVAQGLTNKAIAAALFVSPNTVKTHVSSLMNKLNATSRVQLAAIAARID